MDEQTHCEECDFTYETHDLDAVALGLAALGPRYAEVLTPGIGDSVRDARLRRAPAPGVWSAVEYVCHVRDVLLSQRERLLLALVEETPSFAPIYREKRAALTDYAREDIATLVADITTACSLAARAYAVLDAGTASRRCVYNFPTTTNRSLAWLGQHTLHEANHHFQDVQRSMA